MRGFLQVVLNYPLQHPLFSTKMTGQQPWICRMPVFTSPFTLSTNGISASPLGITLTSTRHITGDQYKALTLYKALPKGIYVNHDHCGGSSAHTGHYGILLYKQLALADPIKGNFPESHESDSHLIAPLQPQIPPPTLPLSQVHKCPIELHGLQGFLSTGQDRAKVFCHTTRFCKKLALYQPCKSNSFWNSWWQQATQTVMAVFSPLSPRNQDVTSQMPRLLEEGAPFALPMFWL